MSFKDKSRSLYGSLKARSEEKRSKAGRVTRRGCVVPFGLDEFRSWLLEQFGGNEGSVIRCAFCKRPLSMDTIVVDHGTPLSRGGGTGFDNLVLACDTCNSVKGRLTVSEFKEFMDLLQQMGVKCGNQAVRDITSRLEKSIKLAASVRYAMAKQRSAESKREEVNENDF